jgi:hypothetical protein
MDDGWPLCACGSPLNPRNVKLERAGSSILFLCGNVSCRLGKIAKWDGGFEVVRFLRGFNELLFGPDEGQHRIRRLERFLKSLCRLASQP